MFWRRFKLDWSYAIGELFIVTLGVLVALAIGQWNSERLERAEEFDVLSRLIADVETDLTFFDLRLAAIDDKEASLLRVRTALFNGGPADAAEFLRDIIVGANFGWNQGLATRTTFDDLLGSGRLGVIADPDVRTVIATYYALNNASEIRIDERETEYPHISYRLVPRKHAAIEEVGVSESDIEPGLGDETLNELVKVAQQSSIGRHVIAEINLARFIRGITTELQTQANNLVARLRDYQANIE